MLLYMSLYVRLCSEMAEASILVVQDQFNCSVCLDLLKDPVTIPCGHSFCMSCIAYHWNLQDQNEVYSCPLCKQTFTPRPALSKNVVFAEMVEKLKQTRLQTPSYAGPGDVECDVCTGRIRKAVKACLMCLESYCQTHLEYHEAFHTGKRHKLTDATGRLKEMICPLHDRLLEIYCRTDQKLICFLCTVWYEHKDHDTVSVAAERKEKQRLLREPQRKLQQRIQESEMAVQELRGAVESHKHSAQAAVDNCEKIFTELIHYISLSELTEMIRDQEKAVVSEAERLLEQLEQEINDLRRRDAELEQFLHTDNHIYFLQTFQSFSVFPGPSLSLLSFDDVGKCFSELKEKFKGLYREERENISGRASVQIIHIPKPKTRQEFLQYSCNLTLDLNTVNENLHLSEENRVITYTDIVQPYPAHSSRFDYAQVLCRESVCGRCYWEVEWSEMVEISVSYKSISRKGRGGESRFGFNDQSWKCLCSSSSYSFWHNYKETELPIIPSSCRIGVYVDHKAGILSFYSVSDTVTLIHTVQTTFTQPLYPGFGVYFGSSLKLCHLTIYDVDTV